MLTATPVVADVDDPVIQGRFNIVDRRTTITGTATGDAMLRVANKSPGGVGIEVRVEPGRPPFKVNTAARVRNLNADRLDGRSIGSFMLKKHYDVDRNLVVDDAEHAAEADNATTADSATNSSQLAGRNRWQFQPALFDFEGAVDFPVLSNGIFDIATGKVVTTTVNLCTLGRRPQSDILVRASGRTFAIEGQEVAKLRLAHEGTPITGTDRRVEGSDGSFAVEWLFQGTGGTETFTLQVNEDHGDVFSVLDAQITVEVLQDTRCEVTRVVAPPGTPDAAPDDADQE